MALIVPRPSPTAAWLRRPAQVRDGLRLYRSTPVWLRRPEVALRLGAAAAVAWFGLLFVALGIHAARVASPAWVVAGYVTATAVGIAGLGVLLTRRPRAGAALIASMLVLGQVVAVASVL